jgi:hypothetical protein
VSATLPSRVTDWPLWWFARLESAVDRDDDLAAREAIRQLERLGIEVRFLLPPRCRNAPADLKEVSGE